MTTRRSFVSSILAALGGSVFAADGRPRTILLQSAWDTVNIGDIGHTPGHYAPVLEIPDPSFPTTLDLRRPASLAV